MLTNNGFYPVRRRIEPGLLRGHRDINGDLDVVGFKIQGDTCEIVIFESKGSARSDIELDDDLVRFSNTVKLLSNNPNKLCDECGISFEGKYLIRGYFVSMANMPNANVPENITFWDFAYFRSELEKTGVPNIYLDLLKQMPVQIELGGL